MRKIFNILIPIFVCFLTGFVSSNLQSDSIQSWYPYLNKPGLTPPNYVFPIAWSILYACMGISIGLILNSTSQRKKYFLGLFVVQLFFNFTWSISFFYLQNPLLGLINIVILDLLVLYYILRTYSEHRLSALLFIPYFLWLSFATYLNTYIWYYN